VTVTTPLNETTTLRPDPRAAGVASPQRRHADSAKKADRAIHDIHADTPGGVLAPMSALLSAWRRQNLLPLTAHVSR
jgi:hypothetical protein